MNLKALAEDLAEDVQIMESPGGDFYITGGHVDLLTAIRRAGSPGSRWKYPPGDVVHIWVFECGDGYLTFDIEEQPNSIPATAIVEPDPGILTQIGPNTFIFPLGKTH
jgi:hypothetical protein